MPASPQAGLGAGPAPSHAVPTKPWVLKQVGTVLASSARERLRGVALETVADVPRSPDELTTEWLTTALCAGTPGARVESLTVLGGSVGTSTRKSIALTYNEAGTAAGLPAQLFVKCTTAVMQRLVLGLGGFINGESGFFNEVRPNVEIEAPAGYFASVDPSSWRSATLMEDVAATKGAEFWTPATRIDKGRMEDLLANMAVWHGAYWDSPRLRAMPWLKTPADHVRVLGLIAGEKRSLVGAERSRAVIPAGIRDRQADLWQGLCRSMELASHGPHTYLHGDPHVGNTYVTDAGRMGWGDWQIGLRGRWVFDYTYILGTALEVEDRRAWEHDLLDGYLDALAAGGGPRLDHDEAFTAVRQMTFYAYFAWVYTIGRAKLQPNFQPDEISLVAIERSAAQIADHESLAAVGL